jgi:hypothetical protein
MWLDRWPYRKKVSIARPASTLIDFQKRFELTDDCDLGAHCRSDGHDIRFTAEDGCTLLSYERDNFSVSNGRAFGLFWVRIPAISATATTEIYLYYGRQDAPDAQDPDRTFSNNYAAVWRLHDTSASHPGNLVQEPGSGDVVHHAGRAELFAMHGSLLEEFYGRDWFYEDIRRNREHPAFSRWSLCQQMVAANGQLSLPVNHSVLTELASLHLDCAVLAASSGGQIRNFSLGLFGNYGDERVRRRIHAIKRNRENFASLMLELSSAAAYLLKKEAYEVTAFEDTGLADFRIESASLPLPIVVDCKSIDAASSPRRFGKVIKKANAQIKAHGRTAYGLVIIDITALINDQILGIDALTDAVPERVKEIGRLVRQELVDHNKSVSAVVLQWDRIIILEHPKGAMVRLQRRNSVVRHKNARAPLPNDDSSFRTEIEVEFVVRNRPNQRETGGIGAMQTA